MSLLKRTRPRAMFDGEILKFHQSLLQEPPNADHRIVRQDFLKRVDQWVHDHNLIYFNGLETFERRDAIIGVTHSLDELHMRFPDLVMTEDDYKYHKRLRPDIRIVDKDTITENDVLVLCVPHPFWGWHPDTYELIDRCKEVHIDAAYYGCSKGIFFDVTHPKIKTVSISLSKALGLGVHRVGIRYSREHIVGTVSLMNEFEYFNVSDMWTAMKFMDHFGTDHWWNKYGDVYHEVCEEMNLQPHHAIHIAWDGPKDVVGVRAAIRMKTEGYNDTYARD